MVIQHNIPAMNAYRNFNQNQNNISASLEKMSTGYKINRAADNAAGLATSEKMRNTITGLGSCITNCEDGIGLVRVADGAIQEIHEILNRMVELSVLATNGTYTDKERQAMQLEVDELTLEVDRIVESTNFNGIPLLNRDMIIDDFFGDYDGDSEELVFLYSTSTSKVQEVYGGNVDNDYDTGIHYSSYYRSADVAIPTEALSVPYGTTLPYVLEMVYTVYNDYTSTLDNANIMNHVVTLEVSEDGDGNLSVKGWSDWVTPEDLDTYAPTGSGTEFYGKVFFTTTKDEAANPEDDTTIYYCTEKEAGKTMSQPLICPISCRFCWKICPTVSQVVAIPQD